MPIPFREGVDMADLKQALYGLSRRDRTAMDSILNPLVEEGIVDKVPLGEPCPVAAPAFVVWRNGKPRVVIDLRRTNSKLLPDAYPLPRQDDILGSLQGSTIFSTMDITKGFFQQPILPSDKWKTAFVSPHRGYERFTVATMGLATSPAFYQHGMEHTLGQYLWQFVLVYIDDIIVYSRTTKDHLNHLALCLALLEKSGCRLSLSKCHFAYAGLEALGHWVSRLGLGTTEEKTKAILALEMPKNLHDLEAGLGLMGYCREFVFKYAQIVDPLLKIKTLGFRGSPPKNPQRSTFATRKQLPPLLAITEDMSQAQKTQRQKENSRRTEIWGKATKAWERIKRKLAEAVDLAFPDYAKPFILHVDTSRKGIGAALHQEQPDGKIRPVLFLSRTLTPAESRYTATELETLGLVWALHKLEHYIDNGKIHVLTDHTAIRDTCQTVGSGKPQGRYRLVNWKLNLAKWVDRITIQHRPGSKHVNADALSRLPISESLPGTLLSDGSDDEDDTHQPPAHDQPSDPDAAATIPDHPSHKVFITTRQGARQIPIPPSAKEPPATTGQAELPPTVGDGLLFMDLVMSSSFRQKIIKALPSDRQFRRIFNSLKETGDKELQNFVLDSSGLMYLRDGADLRLCIPEACIEDVCKAAHDNRAHVGAKRAYCFLRKTCFFWKMRLSLASYVSACPECRKAKPKRAPPYGDLTPIDVPRVPLSTLCLDFMVALPTSIQGHDAVLFITDKTSKFVRALVGGTDWTAEQWATSYVQHIYPDWGLPNVFILDVDPELVSTLWISLCAANILLQVSTAYHHQANNGAERTILTIIHAFRAIMGARLDHSDWEDVLPHVLACLDTSISATTRHVPYEALYGRQAKGFLAPLGPAPDGFQRTATAGTPGSLGSLPSLTGTAEGLLRQATQEAPQAGRRRPGLR